jgi:Protein of unknown function (DUF732)
MTKINLGAAVPLAAAALSVVGSLVLGAAPAHADNDDNVFLRAVHSRGLENKAEGDAGLVRVGHAICTLLADGYSMNAMVDSGELYASKLSADDVKFFVQTSAAAFCPQYIQ